MSTIKNVNENPFAYTGETLDVLLPSGKVVTIRERNADDEDALSNPQDFDRGESIPKFLSRLVTSEKLTWESIQKWPIRDKYYLMFKERRWQFGDTMHFTYKFADGAVGYFDTDLKKYDWDFTKEAPAKGQPGYLECRIVKYKAYGETSMKLTTRSGREYEIDYLTGEGESKTLGMNMSSLTMNVRYQIRNLKVKMPDGKWFQPETYGMISGKDASELRTFMEENDPEFALDEEIVHPRTREVISISLFALTDFFFPRA